MKSETKPHLADAFGGDSELIFWSFRYFLGRMTAAACGFARTLASTWPDIESQQQELIRRELEEEFKRDDEARARNASNGFYPLGNDCDRAAWQLVRDAYNKHTPSP